MEGSAATGIPCSHGEEFYSDQGPENVNPPEPIAALSEKCIVAYDKPHDNRFIIPEPVSSRTRRKLQLGKCDGRQVTSNVEVYSEMEPSSNDEEAEISATRERSRIQAICTGEREAVSKEIACGTSRGSATPPKFSLVYLLAWCPPLHTPYISSPHHCLLFAAHAHSIATCSTVVKNNQLVH